MSRTVGTSAFGIRMPIIREGDDLVEIVVDAVLNSGLELRDRDVIGITESIVARCQGNYVTIDEVAEEIRQKSDNAKAIAVFKPIYSRNRFAMILKAIARAAGEKVYIKMPYFDEVGNVLRNHPFTGLNYDDYYKSIVESEGKKCEIVYDVVKGEYDQDFIDSYEIDARMYSTTNNDEFKDNKGGWCTLAYICRDKCEYGLYGSNKASEEKLKLFPSKDYCQNLVNSIQARIFEETNKNVEVMVYGDGCFKDPVGGIWEFADPVVSPGYTLGLEGTPNEIKIKNFADDKYKDLNGVELEEAIKNEIKLKDKDLKGNMNSQGTTPRRYTDLLGSLMDLVSGSGDKGTPVVVVQGYFDNMSNE